MVDETDLQKRVARLEIESAASRMLSAFLVSQFEKMSPGFAEGVIAAFDEAAGELFAAGTQYESGPALRAEFEELLSKRNVMPKSFPADV